MLTRAFLKGDRGCHCKMIRGAQQLQTIAKNMSAARCAAIFEEVQLHGKYNAAKTLKVGTFLAATARNIHADRIELSTPAAIKQAIYTKATAGETFNHLAYVFGKTIGTVKSIVCRFAKKLATSFWAVVAPVLNEVAAIEQAESDARRKGAIASKSAAKWSENVAFRAARKLNIITA